MSFISDAIIYVGIFLPLLLVVLLLKGQQFKPYLALLSYVLIILISTVTEIWAYQQHGPRGPLYFRVYWAGELINDLSLMLLVMAMTVRTLEGNPIRPKVIRFFVLASIVVIGLPFLIYEGNPFRSTRWNTGASQVLNFAAALMGLGLWTSLIATKKRDSQFLTVLVGIGVSVSSAAFTFGVKRLTGEDSFLREVADYAHRFAQVGSLLIWCWAFWPNRKKADSQPLLQVEKPAA